MATVNQQLAEIRTQLAEITEQMHELVVTKIYSEELIKLGRRLEREEQFGRAAKTSQAHRPNPARPSHLRSIRGDAS